MSGAGHMLYLLKLLKANRELFKEERCGKRRILKGKMIREKN